MQTEGARSASARRIDLALVGAQKSGTSSLAAWLGEHPGIATHGSDEFSFFIRGERSLHASRGPDGDSFISTFDEHFGQPPPSTLVFAKSAGLMYVPGALARLHDHNPDCRLLALLRHPVDRAYSAFWFARLRGWEPLESFEEALRAAPERFSNELHRHLCAYLERGEYAAQIERIHARFGPEKLCVLLTDELSSDPEEACRRALVHAGIRSDPTDPEFLIDTASRQRVVARPRSLRLARGLSHAGGVGRVARSLGAGAIVRPLKRALQRWNATPFEPPALEASTRARLLEHFEEPNRRLERLLDRDLSHWAH